MPIRLRVTAAFAVAMAIVLAVTGVAVHAGLRDELTDGIDNAVEARAEALVALLRERPGARERLDGDDDTFTQVVVGSRVVNATPGLSERPLVGADVDDPRTVTLPEVDDEDDDEAASEPARPRAAGEDRGDSAADERDVPEGEARVLSRSAGARRVIVGTSLEDRNEALAQLGTLLLVGLPVALLAACVVGYGAVAAALRPVERMRRSAEEISAAERGAALPVPPARDELGRLADTLNAMLARLEAALEHERALVADASHELRTPLAMLRTELELALRGERSPEELRSAIASAHEETRHLGRIAEDLLLLARSDRDEILLEVADLDARALLERVRDRFASRAELAVDAPAGLRIDGDADRLEQALGNLVENALTHGEGAIELAARPGELAVRDAGPGFPPEFIPRAFDRFTRASEARTGGGAGLGLAIVALIARGHGGAAEARNREAGGAEVVIRLPARARPRAASPARSRAGG